MSAFTQLLKGKGAARLVAHARDPSELHYFFDRSRGAPTVLFLGRANVGKSSLINKLVGRNKLVRSGQTPGLTQHLGFYGVGDPAKLFLVDAPGYGSRGRPEWGAMVDAYLDTPNNHLQRVFVLLNYQHGLVSKSDPTFLRYMAKRFDASHGAGFTFQVIFTKFEGRDATLDGPRVKELEKQIFDLVPTCLPPIFTSAQDNVGVEDVRRAVGEACGLKGDLTRAYKDEMGRAEELIEEDEYYHVTHGRRGRRRVE